MCVSPVCIVLGGVTPGGILICSTVTCLPIVEDRQQLAVLLCLAV